MPPKRKAASKLSQLVDGDVEDDELNEPQIDATEDHETAPPPAKRTRGGRKPAPTATTVPATTTAKRTTRKPVAPKPKKQPAKRATKTTRKPVEEEPEEYIESGGEGPEEYEDAQEAGEDQGVSADELDSPRTVPQLRKGQAHADRKPASRVFTDDEFEYTPAGSRKGRQQPKPKGGGRGAGRQVELPAEPEEDDVSISEVDETVPEFDETVLRQPGFTGDWSSPLKGQTNGKPPYRRSTTQEQRRKSVRIEEPGENEAVLRRKLGDVTNKLENAENKYRSLREVGIVEANANMENLRKQCEATTAG